MMGHKEKVKNSTENEALSSAHLFKKWRAGQRARAKKFFNKRLRKLEKSKIKNIFKGLFRESKRIDTGDFEY